MISTYLDKALEQAKHEQERDRWFGEIPGFPGVWADAATLGECKSLLREILEEWVLLKMRDGDNDIPGSAVAEGIRPTPPP